MVSRQEKQRAREIGYAMVNSAQDRRKLYRFANLLVNTLAEIKPSAIQDLANITLSTVERQEIKEKINRGMKI